MNNEDYINELKKENLNLKEQLNDKNLKLKIALLRYDNMQKLYFEYLVEYGVLNKKNHSRK